MAKPRRVWITEIEITPEVEQKIQVKHRVSRSEVDEAVKYGHYRDARWHEHDVYGERLLVRGSTDADVELLVVLKPVDQSEGIWECKTARRTGK